jgi:hypothetical protein
MRKAIVYLAGASELALVAFAPTAASAGRDWGVTVSPGGVDVGPKADYRSDYRYRRDRYDDRYTHYDDDDDWRYRRDRRDRYDDD